MNCILYKITLVGNEESYEGDITEESEEKLKFQVSSGFRRTRFVKFYNQLCHSLREIKTSCDGI